MLVHESYNRMGLQEYNTLKENQPGHYTYTGSQSNDKIQLKFSRGHQQPPMVEIWANGKLVERIPEGKIKSLKIYGGKGNNSISVDPLINAPIKIYGGDGKDKISCNSTNTRVFTGAGNDRVFLNRPLRNQKNAKPTEIKSFDGNNTRQRHFVKA